MCSTDPSPYGRASTRSRLKGLVSPANSGSPSPSATGWTTSRYSSTRRSLLSVCANAAPPQAIRSPPGSRLSAATSSARSSPAIVVPAQSALVSVLENTTLGVLFIGAAYASSEKGQNPAISSYVTRPIRCRPASRSQPSFRCVSAGSSGGVPQPPAPNRPGRATIPSSETPISRTSLLIVSHSRRGGCYRYDDKTGDDSSPGPPSRPAGTLPGISYRLPRAPRIVSSR